MVGNRELGPSRGRISDRSFGALILATVVALAPVTARAATSLTYSSALLVVDGVITETPSHDRFTMTDGTGSTVDVRMEPGHTFIASRDIVAVGKSVEVFGHASGSAEIVAEEVDAHGLQAFHDDKTKHTGALRYVLGAAAGVLVGSGIYGLSHGWFRAPGNATPSPSTGAALPAASVQFGNGQ